MWAFVVVVVDDVVELAVEFIDAGGRWFVSESDFECLVEALDFALGLWVIGFAAFLVIPMSMRSCSKPFREGFFRSELVVKARPLSVRVDWGQPWVSAAVVKLSMTFPTVA